MSTQENNITTRFSVDISELRAGIQEANRNIRLANSEFKAATAGMSDWAHSADGLTAKLRQLNTVQEQERRKLENMRQEYRQIVEEQGESSRAAQEFAVRLNNQQAVVNRTEREIREYTERLDEIQNASDNASESARDLGQAVESAGRDAERAEGRFGSLSSRLAKGIGKGIATGIKAIGAATVGLASAFLATGEASQEFAEDMGKLEAGFKSVGHSGETAKKSYMGMVGILGETDQSVEAVNHLARLTKSEEELAKWTDIAAGVYGTFGDSLPLEGLTEAANETAKVGKVTGPLADALNWAGISEDAFNESLARCSSEQERATLITETLSKTYEDAAKIYKETNKDLIEARQASAEWTDAMAEVGKVAMPVTTSIKRFGASLLTSLVPGLKEAGEGLRGLGEGIDGSSEKLQSGIKKAIDGLLGKIQEAVPVVLQVGTQIAISLAQGVVQALPEVTTTIVSMIPMLAQAIVDLLPQMQTAGFEIVRNIMTGISQMFPDLAVMAVELVSMLSQGFLNGIPQLIEAGFALFTSVVKSLPQVIDKIVSELPKIVDSIVSVLVTGTPKIMEGIIALFNGFVEAIPLVVPKIVQALPTLVQGLTAGLAEMIPALVTGAVTFLMAIVDAIPQILPPLVQAIPVIVSTLVQGLLENLPVLIQGAIALFMGIIDAIPILIEDLVPMIPQIVQTIADTLVENLPLLVEGAIALFMGLAVGLAQAVEKILPMLPQIIGTLIVGLLDLITTAFSGAVEIIEKTFKPLLEFFAYIWDGIKLIFSDVAQVFGEIFAFARDAVQQAWSSVVEWFGGIWTSIKDTFSSVGDFFGNIFYNAWKNIRDVWSGVYNFFRNLWDSITGLFGSFGTTVANIIGGAVKGVINSVIGTAENALNGGIRLLNGAIGLINKIPGVNLGKIGLVDFPRLAKGGFVNGNTFAELGEQGKKEVVLPLERNLQWAKILANQLMKEMKTPLAQMNTELVQARNQLRMQVYGDGSHTETVKNVTFNQYNTSPKAISRVDLYRQTNGLLFGAKGRLGYV